MKKSKYCPLEMLLLPGRRGSSEDPGPEDLRSLYLLNRELDKTKIAKQ
jgi:hypothetical protein